MECFLLIGIGVSCLILSGCLNVINDIWIGFVVSGNYLFGGLVKY